MLKKLFLFPLLLFISSVLIISCGNETETGEMPDTTQVEQSWDVRGYYLDSNAEVGTITIVHEEIPDVMAAMRMRMLLPNPEEAEGLSRGEAISFRLYREGNSWYVNSIETLPDDEAPELDEELMDLI